MALDRFEKTPGEQYPISFNYKGRLPAGAVIESAVATAIEQSRPETDATSTVIVDEPVVVDGTSITFKIKGGTVGKLYRLTVVLSLAGGEGDNIEDSCLMSVVSVHS